LTYIVINTILGRLTLDPAGMHCPSWDDAFVSSLLVSASLVVPILASSAVTTSSVLSDGQPSTVMTSGSLPAASEDGQHLASSDVERPPTTPSRLTPGEHLNSEVFDPCVVSPHPQAGERKSVKNARK